MQSCCLSTFETGVSNNLILFIAKNQLIREQQKWLKNENLQFFKHIIFLNSNII